VVLSFGGDKEFVGEADGITSQAGELRCAAEAALHALRTSIEKRLDFELLGVKSVRAFDATVVIVSLSALAPDTQPVASRLVGSYLTETDPQRGAALAVLHATNRLLGNYLQTR